jgi:hypothetical protein
MVEDKPVFSGTRAEKLICKAQQIQTISITRPNVQSLVSIMYNLGRSPVCPNVPTASV